jgi:hypothetical protein
MLVTLECIRIEVKVVNPKKAASPILETLFGILLFFVPDIIVLSELRIRLFPSLLKCELPETTSILAKFIHCVNGLPTIFETLTGMVIVVSPEQRSKALEPIVVTVFGMITEFKLCNPAKACPLIVATPFGIVLFLVPDIR